MMKDDLNVHEYAISLKPQTESCAPAGCSKRLSSKATASEEARRTLRYVEPLSDARTKLEDFFNILLDMRITR